MLAIDGLQPDVGNEGLWVIRECLSGEVLLARPLLSATETDLAALFREVLICNLPARHVALKRTIRCWGLRAEARRRCRPARC